MSAATLLEDGFEEALIYWQANNMGTRAGLIAHLMAQLGISQNLAIKWVDAVTQEAFDTAISDDITYGTFKARMIAVSNARAKHAADTIFNNLKLGLLIQDATDQLIAKHDETIAALDVQISNTSAAITDLENDTPSNTRDTSLIALNRYLSRLQKQREGSVVERNRLAALTG